jgi:hypothetical protein
LAIHLLFLPSFLPYSHQDSRRVVLEAGSAPTGRVHPQGSQEAEDGGESPCKIADSDCEVRRPRRKGMVSW